MTESDLKKIEAVMTGEDDPGTCYWVETVQALIAEVRRCGGPWERIEQGAAAWGAIQRAKQ